MTSVVVRRSYPELTWFMVILIHITLKQRRATPFYSKTPAHDYLKVHFATQCNFDVSDTYARFCRSGTWIFSRIVERFALSLNNAYLHQPISFFGRGTERRRSLSHPLGRLCSDYGPVDCLNDAGSKSAICCRQNSTVNWSEILHLWILCLLDSASS